MASNERGRRWRVLGASVRGTGHERTGQPCQDAHGWTLASPDVLVVAVADGAGSAPLGEVGSFVAARRVVQAVTDDLRLRSPGDDDAWRELVGLALEAARRAVEAEAAWRGVELRDLATTLIVAVATPSVVAAAHVGDGAVIVASANGTLVALTTPDTGEHANETTFLTGDGWLARVRSATWRGETAHVALFSDGIQRLALELPAAVPHGPFFAPLLRFARDERDEREGSDELERFLQSPRVTERADDDLTLVLATLE